MNPAAESKLAQLEERGPRANPFRAGRTMAMGRNGLVATSHTYATQAGLDALRSGGNAMDAAIAAAATLSVVEPMMTGLGGDVFLLYYEAKTGTVHALNGSGRSPGLLRRDYFNQRDKYRKRAINDAGWESVTVPGAADAWQTALARFGTRKFPDLFAQAIHYAEQGFPVTECVAHAWKENEILLKLNANSASTYLVEGKAPGAGTLFKNPKLGATLRTLAAEGRDAFYLGSIAEEIVRYSNETKGFLQMEDFAAHASEWVDPISVDYRGFDVYQCPPNGHGLGVLLMLNLLEDFDLEMMAHNSPEYLHLLIEAKKVAYADLARHVADPRRTDVPLKELLSKAYAEERRKLIDKTRAAAEVEAGVPEIPTCTDTICLAAIDKEGNAVSFINSIFAAFGSKITAGQTGILMQNRGAGFTLEMGHPNEYAPNKRPYHTIIPGMILRSGKLYMAYGLMGGMMQPQGHVQFLLNHLEFGLNLQEAVDCPRWRHTEGLHVNLEHGFTRATIKALGALGHDANPAFGGDFGGAQAVMVDARTGTYFGASDPRKDGAALGY